MKATKRLRSGGGFCKIADRFVEHFLTKEGESVEDAKIRLAAEQKIKEEASAAERRQHMTKQKEMRFMKYVKKEINCRIRKNHLTQKENM